VLKSYLALSCCFFVRWMVTEAGTKDERNRYSGVQYTKFERKKRPYNKVVDPYLHSFQQKLLQISIGELVTKVNDPFNIVPSKI
jgi:hypothetical protein